MSNPSEHRGMGGDLPKLPELAGLTISESESAPLRQSDEDNGEENSTNTSSSSIPSRSSRSFGRAPALFFSQRVTVVPPAPPVTPRGGGPPNGICGPATQRQIAIQPRTTPDLELIEAIHAFAADGRTRDDLIEHPSTPELPSAASTRNNSITSSTSNDFQQRTSSPALSPSRKIERERSPAVRAAC